MRLLRFLERKTKEFQDLWAYNGTKGLEMTTWNIITEYVGMLTRHRTPVLWYRAKSYRVALNEETK